MENDYPTDVGNDDRALATSRAGELRRKVMSELFSRSYGRVVDYLVRSCGVTRPDAEDIAAEAFTRILAIENLNSVSSVKHSLFRNARNLARDLTKSRAGPEHVDTLINSTSSMEIPSPEPSGKTHAKIVNTVISGVSAGAAIGAMIVPGTGALFGSILGGIVGALAQDYLAKAQHTDSPEKSSRTDDGGAQ
jgi:uncharacterized membrane protein YeaQ/YmgE (transglycosylase-associated protein family)